MGRKTPPFDEYPTWTTARFWGFIRSALRSAFTKWPPKYEALKVARIPVTGKGNQKWAYKCAMCDKLFLQKDVQVDHIEPVGSLKDFSDLPGFVQRMFVGFDKFQILCKPCHKAKTKEERNT